MNNSKSFVLPHDPILGKIAQTIHPDELKTDEIKQIIEKMLQVGYGEQEVRDMPVLVGLAAPQIGISKRIILVDTQADGKGKVGKLEVFVNPEIMWKSEEKSEWYEGCFSTGNVCGIVKRSDKIRVRYHSLSGDLKEKKFSGYTARAFQHEVDHLNGKEFVTHIHNPDNLHWVKDSEFVEYRNNEAWRNWRKKCSFEKWEGIKSRGM